MHVEQLVPCICYSVQQSLFGNLKFYMTQLICKEVDIQFLLKRYIYESAERQSCCF